MPKFSRRRGCGKQAPGKKAFRRSIKTANRSKDIDQIQDEIYAINNNTPVAHHFNTLPYDIDKAGAGQHYCRYCAKDFISAEVLQRHQQTKVHKKRVKLVNQPQYTQREAEAAAGMAAPVR